MIRDPGLWFIVITNTQWVKVFRACDSHCFRAEMWRRVGRTDWGTDASPRISVVFFSSYKLPKTVTVTTLILFGHVKLLCGNLSEGPVQLSDCLIDTPLVSVHTGSVRQSYARDTECHFGLWEEAGHTWTRAEHVNSVLWSCSHCAVVLPQKFKTSTLCSPQLPGVYSCRGSGLSPQLSPPELAPAPVAGRVAS